MSTPELVRFEAAEANERGDRPGIFAVFKALRESGRLSPADAALASELVDRSYRVHHEPDAAHFDTVPKARSWFRADAPREVWQLVDDLLAMLDTYGVGWREVRTADPGRITYVDDRQVVAVPHE